MAQTRGGARADLLGISANKEKDFSEWYTQIVTRTDLIDYHDISGCYILRPDSFSVWEAIQKYFDGEIKKLGVRNAYFPIFVSQNALQKEENHVEGFAPEVAWVTKSGSKPLAEPIAVRPTSETIMYPLYAKWIRSHRDLPLKINQWSNVVRWEFKHPTPFIRSREFLWQEGHTAFATQKEADEEVLQILDLYAKVYEDLLAVPVIKGKKTEEEKFPGGLYTTTVECFIPASGRGVQAATSHCLGQNFAKMFNIQFESETNSEKQLVWQNSWGLTTRSIGIMIMIHGDNKGLVMPPRVAPIQIVLIPLFFKNKDSSELKEKARELKNNLESKGFRIHLDDREGHNPGFKYNQWELKGVPLRLELGPKDLEQEAVTLARRDTGAKESGVLWKDLAAKLEETLEDIQKSLLEKAKKERDQRIVKVLTFEEFIPALDNKNIVLTPWCGEHEAEDEVKKKTKEIFEAEVKKNTAKKSKKKTETADKGNEDGKTEDFEQLSAAPKTLCIPFDQPELPEGTKCFFTQKEAKCWVLWGRSY